MLTHTDNSSTLIHLYVHTQFTDLHTHSFSYTLMNMYSHTLTHVPLHIHIHIHIHISSCKYTLLHHVLANVQSHHADTHACTTPTQIHKCGVSGSSERFWTVWRHFAICSLVGTLAPGGPSLGPAAFVHSLTLIGVCVERDFYFLPPVSSPRRAMTSAVLWRPTGCLG